LTPLFSLGARRPALAVVTTTIYNANMSTSTPEDVVQAFFSAFNRGDLEALMSLYEAQPSMVVEPGRIVEGQAAVREAFLGFLALKPTLTPEKKKIIVANDLALSVAKWSLKGIDPDGLPLRIEGTTSDVLRKQPDGRWLFAIDNPWGTDILG
jgi:ketosteroid isomerase-like protein